MMTGGIITMKKKIMTMMCTLAVFTQGFSAAAADSAEMPKLDPSVTEQLLEFGCDKDEDGTISAEEFAAIRNIYLNLTDISDLSFLKEMPHLRSLALEKGSFSDLSILASLPQLTSLSLHSMALDDLSFLKKMALDYCVLDNVTCAAAFDKTELLQLQDYTFEQGYAETISIKPYALFDAQECEIKIDDHSLIFEDDEFGINRSEQDLYTLAVGETPYHILLNGKEVYQGTIRVIPQNLTHEPITHEIIEWADYVFPKDNGSVADARVGSRLFHFDGGEVTLLRENVSALQSIFLDSFSGSSSFYVCTMELHSDGTLLTDGEEMLPDEHIVSIRENCALTDDHKLFALYRQNNSNIWIQIADDCAEMLATEDLPIYLSDNGKVCLYTINAASKTANVKVTDIAEPQKYFYGNVLDKNHVVWKYEKGILKKVAENAVDIGIFHTDDGDSHICYINTDGSACLLDGSNKLNVVEEPTCDLKNAVNGSFFFNDWYQSGAKGEEECGGRWRLSDDGILTISYQEQRFAIDHAVNVINEGYDEAANLHYVYFARKDASIWRYCIENNSAELLIEGEAPSSEKGDLNGDGKISAADAVILTKWLTGQNTSAFSLPQADLNSDNIINASDLTLLKRSLLNG